MDESDFKQAIIHELPAVYRLAYHLSSNRHEVDDLVQETYLHALKASAKFELTSRGLRPWLFKILHNVVNEHYGKQQRDAKLIGGIAETIPAEGEVPASGQPPGAEPSQVQGIDWEHVDQRLKRAIDELPMNLKTAFLLSAVEGLRYREIADVTDSPVGTVMSRLFRARAILASRLGQLASESGIGRDQEVPKNEMNSPT